MLRRAVEPIIERRISHPRMMRTNMIRHLILDHLQPQRIALFEPAPAQCPDRRSGPLRCNNRSLRSRGKKCSGTMAGRSY